MLKAKKAVIPVWTKENLGGEEESYGQDGSPTRVVEIWRPEMKKEGRVITGEPAEVASILYQELKKLGVV
jgi:electron transfer flavoprotein beta subunit